MNISAYADFLLSHMTNAKYASGKQFINCRCPECGDSIHRESAHMYIRIPWDEDEPSWYYCHKCHFSSIMSYKKLLEWNIYDKFIAEELQELNLKVLNGPRKSKYTSSTIYRITHTLASNQDEIKYKCGLMNNRLGVNLTPLDYSNLKIIFSLNDLLYENHISKLTRDPNIVKQLSDNFIGFLSKDNAFLNMRKFCEDGVVHPNIDKRYINYKIFDKFDTTQRFYCVPNEVNLNTPYRNKLHIAEGPFDILSIYLNLRDRSNDIFTCVAGSNYIAVIMFFLIDFMLPNFEIHFYPDNDKFGTNETIWNIVNKIPDTTIPIFIHRNTSPGEKDFGVSLDRIKESIVQIRR